MARDIVRCTSELFSLEVADNGLDGDACLVAEQCQALAIILYRARASTRRCTEIEGGHSGGVLPRYRARDDTRPSLVVAAEVAVPGARLV